MHEGEAHMTNEGTLDRVIRVVVGLGILSLTFLGPQSRWGLVGLVPLLTGVVGFCPLYRIVGISTCAVPRKA
jgi:hypothetical protein